MQAPLFLAHHEGTPALPVFFHYLGCTNHFTVAFFVYRHGHQDRYILIFSAPVSLEIDAVQIDIGILVLELALPPFFYMAVNLFVQIADRAGGHLAAPQRRGNILHSPDGYPCQIHLDQRLFH